MKTSIVKPLITEKTMHMTAGSWYTFRVDVSADKQRIRKEIEKLYSVSVLAIRTCLMHGKKQRVGRKGKTIVKSDWKKAYVKLKPGQTIDAFQVGGSEVQK